MPPPHVIQLPEPWHATPMEGGRIQFRRRFGWTAVLGPNDHVFLVVGNVQAAAAAWVNGTHLGRFDPESLPVSFDISTLLRLRNEAVIQVAGGHLAEVRLEIDSNE